MPHVQSHKKNRSPVNALNCHCVELIYSLLFDSPFPHKTNKQKKLVLTLFLRVSHRLKWKIKKKVANKNCCVSGFPPMIHCAQFHDHLCWSTKRDNDKYFDFPKIRIIWLHFVFVYFHVSSKYCLHKCPSVQCILTMEA